VQLLDLISGLLRRGGGWQYESEALPEEVLPILPPAALELAGAQVYVLARGPLMGLSAELAVEVMQRAFKREALEGLRALVIVDASRVEWAAREARRRGALLARAAELAERAFREGLEAWRPFKPRELPYFGVYDDGEGVAVVGVHPGVSFSGWVYAVSHELLHHAFRRCPGRGENLKPLAEALLEMCPSLRERFSAEELAGDEVAAHFLEEEAVDLIARQYFERGAREPGPAERRLWLAELCFRLRVGERAFLKALKRGRLPQLEPLPDEPLRRAAHALLLRWIQRFPADVYAEKLAELADAYAARLRELAEEATQRLRWLAESKPEPDLVFSVARKLERLGELARFE
jgi:hypothetical protein